MTKAGLKPRRNEPIVGILFFPRDLMAVAFSIAGFERCARTAPFGSVLFHSGLKPAFVLPSTPRGSQLYESSYTRPCFDS